jgi:hypothetical protein
MVKRGGYCAGTVDATAIDHQDHLFRGGANDGHHLMEILTACVGIDMGHDCREDARGTVLDGADAIESYPAGEATPAAVLLPGLTFEALLGVDVALAYGSGGQAGALAAAPPPASGQGTAPQHGLILVEQNDLVVASPIFQGLQVEAALGQVCGVRLACTRGAAVAQRVFF